MRIWTRAALVVAAIVGMTAPALAGPKDAASLARIIDRGIDQQLQAGKIQPSPQADDAEFLRRVYLDLIGVIPPADKAAAFLDSTDPNKREKLVDELLADERYGRHFADIWVNRMYPRDSMNRRLTPEPLHKWMAEQFNKNRPWDQQITDLITATGDQSKNGAVTFWLANATVDKMTDTVTEQFLGIQLQCAQCHNHPFTGWKRTEYWGMAAFFTKVRADRPRKDSKDLGVSEIVAKKGRKARLPDSAKIVPAKFLGAEEPKLSDAEPYRPVLAKWLTSRENPYFARAIVNRTWGHFFGRGIVNPIDDMHDGNKPSHPELLKELSSQLIEANFDLKHFMKGVVLSKTYQRTSKPAGNNADDANLFSHMNLKPFTPEELYDCLKAVAGEPQRNARDTRRKGRPGNNPRANFAAFFRPDDVTDPTEYQNGIPQALRLMNSAEFNRRSQLLDESMKAGKTPEQVIEKLYLGTVSRRPTASESRKLAEYVAKKQPREAYTDVLWALMNSSEFSINH